MVQARESAPKKIVKFDVIYRSTKLFVPCLWSPSTKALDKCLFSIKIILYAGLRSPSEITKEYPNAQDIFMSDFYLYIRNVML